MFISLDFFGLDEGAVFKTNIGHVNYNELQITGAVIDEIYVDEDVEIPITTDKPESWTYSTILNAKFQGNLEAGSLSANGSEIDLIKFQKRRWDELEWTDVGEVKYNEDGKVIYELLDKFVANQQVYQYSLLPVTSSVLGGRVLSEEITVDFEGVFLSDKDNNYRLLYDLQFGDINHNTPSSVFETLNSKYPIVVYSNLDYTDFDVEATFVSASTSNGETERQVDTRMEKTERDNLLRWVKNHKPKIYRDVNGELKLVTVVDNPQEKPMSGVNGIAKISFKMVEIGSVDTESLKAYGMLDGGI